MQGSRCSFLLRTPQEEEEGVNKFAAGWCAAFAVVSAMNGWWWTCAQDCVLALLMLYMVWSAAHEQERHA